MGCGGSKPRPPAPSKAGGSGGDACYSSDEAASFLEKELAISSKQAKVLMESCTPNCDGKHCKKEMGAFVQKVQDKKKETTDAFKAKDGDGSGTVATEDALEVAKNLFKEADEEKLAALLGKFADDGKVQYEAFVVFYSHISSMKECLCKALEGVSKDEEGTVSAEDAANCIAEHCAVDQGHAQALIDDFGHNSEGRVNVKEFESFLCTLFGDGCGGGGCGGAAPEPKKENKEKPPDSPKPPEE